MLGPTTATTAMECRLSKTELRSRVVPFDGRRGKEGAAAANGEKRRQRAKKKSDGGRGGGGGEKKEKTIRR